MAWAPANPLNPFQFVQRNLENGYQFGDVFRGLSGFYDDYEGDQNVLSQLGNLVSGQTDFDRNMALASYEHDLNREDMQLQNAFTAEREDLAYARNRQDALEARQWEEMMANTSIRRQVADMKAAGLNPWLAAGGSGAVVPSAQLPGATSSSSAGISPIKLPVSKIWANTSEAFKTTASNLLSLAMIAKIFM